MPFQKGHKLSGSRKGIENKTTSDIKEAYAMLIRSNIPNLIKWLEIIAEKDPAKAIYILADLSEYVIPKLARTDLTNDGEKFDFGATDEELIKDAIAVLKRTGEIEI